MTTITVYNIFGVTKKGTEIFRVSRLADHPDPETSRRWAYEAADELLRHGRHYVRAIVRRTDGCEVVVERRGRGGR